MINVLDIYSNNAHSPVIETKNGILLKGQYYTKENLAPISFSGCNFNVATGYNTLNLTTSCYLDTSIRAGLRNQDFNITTDPYIDNKYYFNINNNHSDTNTGLSYFIQSTEQENDLLIDSIKSSPENFQNYKIIDVDKNYIYIFSKSISGLSNLKGTAFYRINKKTNAYEQICNDNTSYRTLYFKIYSDDRYIYFACHTNGRSYVFYRYDKTANVITKKNISLTTWTEGSDTGNIFYTCENVRKVGNFCYFYAMYHSNDRGQSMIGVKIDITKDVNESNFISTYLCMGLNSNIKWNNSHTGYEIHKSWIIGNHLYYILYDEDYVSGYISSINVQGIHTFEILSDNKLKYISYNQIDNNDQIISIVFSSNKRILIIGFWKSFLIMKYNDDTKQYEVLNNNHYINVSTVGFDEYDRLWIMHTDKSIHVYDINEPQSSTINFQHNAYIYDDKNIESYIEFSAKSFLGEYAKGLYRFELIGPVYFTNGQKTIEVQYTGNIQQVPIIVTGSDQLGCKMYFVKGGEQ